MEIGIIGLPMVGKTTLFNLLTNAEVEISNFYSGRTDTNVGMAKVPDPRLDFLTEMYKPRKTIYPQIQFVDVVGLVRGASKGEGVGNEFLNAIRNSDALLHVLRAFDNPDVPHIEDSVDPLRDLETLNTELLLSDLDLIEKRLERIAAGKKRKEQEVEIQLLHRCKEALEAEKPLHTLEMTPEEEGFLRSYQFLTQKPAILVVNVDEEQFKKKDYPGKAKLREWAGAHGVPCLEVCGRMELEISRLDPADREVFLADLGLTESGIDRIAKTTYDHLGLISFLTAGEDEVRAWQIQRGTNARDAAGKIHTDIARGFIKAEVVAFADLKKLGSMAKVKEAGLYRLEGKEYLVQDGDIINFRFNV